jgi:hypothetical protein
MSTGVICLPHPNQTVQHFGLDLPDNYLALLGGILLARCDTAIAVGCLRFVEFYGVCGGTWFHASWSQADQSNLLRMIAEEYWL